MPRTDGRKRTALVLLCAAVFLDSMDLSLMGVALPATGIGVAALAAVTTLGDSVVGGYRIAFLTAGAFSLAGALITLYGLRPRYPAPIPTR